MSKTDASIKKKRTKEDRKKLAVRIICLVLALLMVGSMAYYTIYVLTASAKAEEDEAAWVLDTSSLKNGGDFLVSIGLMYGDNVTTGFQCTTTDGYTLGIQYLDGGREFYEIWDINDEVVSCTSDANLSKTGMTYLITENERDTVIGGYHIQVDCDSLNRDELEELIRDSGEMLYNLGFYAIPSYIYTGYALRIGSFSSYDDAERYLDDIEDIFGGFYVSVVYPTETAVSLLNPYTDEILFEYDCGGESELGLRAHTDENGNTYIRTPAMNVYDGVFCFKRYINGAVDGVSLINVLPLEAYIAGVLPYETSNSWLLETLKAFAITVRSYTLTNLHKHESYGFDLCNTTECQVYKGAGRINENVMEAVIGTKGDVMTYDGDIVVAYYSSSMGGVTVSAQDAWGGVKDYPYLQAVETPWENYMVHNNAFWISEISPKDLLERLHTAGYDELEGEIAEVEIEELAKNSTYVKKLKVTDIYGTTVTITNTDKVRTSLTPYVKSANFVVGRGQVEYTEDVIIDYVEPIIEDTASYDMDYGYINIDECYVLTSDNTERNYDAVTVLTSDGEITHDRKDIFVMARQNTAAFLGEEYLEYAETEAVESPENRFSTTIVEDKSTDEVLYKIAYAEDSDNFIFVGKGWGHGVGMSQYGALDMAALGYTANEILEAYFKDIKIMNYTYSDNFR